MNQLTIIVFHSKTEDRLVEFISQLISSNPFLFQKNPSIFLLTDDPILLKKEDIQKSLKFQPTDTILLIAENVKKLVFQICENFTFLKKRNDHPSLDEQQKQELTKLIAEKIGISSDEKITLNEAVVFEFKEEETPKTSRSTGDIVSFLLSPNCQGIAAKNETVRSELAQENYRLEKNLETNNEGVAYEIWEATQISTYERQVILFVIQDLFRQKEDLLVSFVKQIKQPEPAANKIPGIIVPTDLGCINNYVFLVVGPISGISLDTLINKNQKGISVEEIRPCLEAMKKILVQLHEQKEQKHEQKEQKHEQKEQKHEQKEQKRMCLEFLRPANIFYDLEKKTVTLVNWQIPLSTQERDSYKSYETLLDEKDLAKNAAAPADDVYSLAVITYQLLSGKHPFAEKIATEAKNQDMSPTFLNNLNPRQWEALTKGLAFERKDRTQSINEFLESFLNKTLYDFIKQMVEAPFFIGLVIGGIFLIFTTVYLYSGSGGISQLEENLKKVEQSQNISPEPDEVIASLQKQLDELQKQLNEEKKSSSSAREVTANKLKELREIFKNFADKILLGNRGIWGKITCSSAAAINLAFPSIENVVDIDLLLINQDIEKDLLWVGETLEQLEQLECKPSSEGTEIIKKLENYQKILKNKVGTGVD